MNAERAAKYLGSEKWKEARGEEQENDWWKREEMRGAGGLCTVRRVDKAAVMRCWAPAGAVTGGCTVSETARNAEE